MVPDCRRTALAALWQLSVQCTAHAVVSAVAPSSLTSSSRSPCTDHRYAEVKSVSEEDDDDEAQAAKPKAAKKVIKDQGYDVICKKCKGSFRLQKADGVTFCAKNDEL